MAETMVQHDKPCLWFLMLLFVYLLIFAFKELAVYPTKDQTKSVILRILLADVLSVSETKLILFNEVFLIHSISLTSPFPSLIYPHQISIGLSLPSRLASLQSLALAASQTFPIVYFNLTHRWRFVFGKPAAGDMDSGRSCCRCCIGW